MSLINQMLRDLEQRRSAEAGASPLGGLSASGSATQAVSFSINYVTMAVLVAVLFVGGVIVAYLLGEQQHAVADVASPVVTPVIEAPVSAPMNNAGQTKVLTKIAPVEMHTRIEASDRVLPMPKPVVHAVVMAPVIKETVHKVKEKAVVQPVSAIAITPVVEKIETRDETSDEIQANVEQHINKTIRPLTEEEQSQQAFQRAIKLLSRGKQQQAQQTLEGLLTLSPTHVRARETLAALLLNTGRVSEAASSLRDGLHLMPSATSLAKLYARILVDQGDASAAVGVLERARPAVSADPDYYALLAALYRQEKKHAQAAQVYQQILMQRPGVASWWMGLALSEDAMGRNEKALVAFQRAQRAGGLNAKVLQYVQARIVALTPATPVPAKVEHDFDEFGE